MNPEPGLWVSFGSGLFEFTLFMPTRRTYNITRYILDFHLDQAC